MSVTSSRAAAIRARGSAGRAISHLHSTTSSIVVPEQRYSLMLPRTLPAGSKLHHQRVGGVGLLAGALGDP
jgi:hypothetical protein